MDAMNSGRTTFFTSDWAISPYRFVGYAPSRDILKLDQVAAARAAIAAEPRLYRAPSEPLASRPPYRKRKARAARTKGCPAGRG